MVLTRSPLEAIGMNGAGAPKRRSARLSNDAAEENEPPAKRSRANGAQSTTVVSTKEQDGEGGAASRRKRKGKILLVFLRENVSGCGGGIFTSVVRACFRWIVSF